MARMRLRSRPTPDDRVTWVAGWPQPRLAGRWTTIGNLDGSHRASVDPAGGVVLEGAGWTLDWWVGAEDRWHLPAQEVAVRQALVGSSPVVETRLRVPGGDAVHRAYAARAADGTETVVVEVENQTSVPFAVALALRPFGATALGALHGIELDDERVLVDGTVVLQLPGTPGRATLSTRSAGDAAEVVLAGEAERTATASVQCRDGLATAVVLFPLAHTATLRIALPRAGLLVDDLATLPGPGDVASGWSRQVARGARVEVPDRRLRDATAASARHLLLARRTPAVAVGLDLLGLAAEAAPAVELGATALAATTEPGLALEAVVRHWELTGDDGFAARASESVGWLVAALRDGAGTPDGARGAAALPGAARLLAAAGEERAAADVRRLLDGWDVATTAASSLADLLSSATGTWTWPGPSGGHDPARNAELVALVRSLLVVESGAGLALCPEVPEQWLGQGWELHDAPTRHGALSYAVRWHGDRPALLWQLDPHAGGSPVTLTAPGLDPSWSSRELAGEALLAAVALPAKSARRGLSLPVTIEPLSRRTS